jgi:hypothetical protein
MSSIGKKAPPVFVNEFQREEFEKYGVKRRDPMFITCAALMELEASGCTSLQPIATVYATTTSTFNSIKNDVLRGTLRGFQALLL